MNDFLDTIKRLKEEEVAAKKRERPLSELWPRTREFPPPRDFPGALRQPGVSLIAEVKRASPSAGIIAESLDPASQARDYQEGGAAAISVLTESTYFGGTLDDLQTVSKAVGIPVLRKDFIIDSYQIYESRAAGADAVLLISELLELQQLVEYLVLAHHLGIACLIESHGKSELSKAIISGALILGINNRDLTTLEVDPETAVGLLPLIPDDRVKVAESGIKTADDVRKVTEAGADAILVGETLVRSGDVKATIKELLLC